ncbi:MAG: MaoC family dehydratase N-terminal domain-containing protein [Chloroflexota bacterium]
MPDDQEHIEDSVITDEMRAHLEVESEPVVYDVERGAVARFAEAIGDPNPVYTDEKAARHSSYGGLTAPPTFLRALIAGPHSEEFPEPFPNVLDGGSEYRFYEPVRVGDRITVTRALVDLFEKDGKLGRMLFKVYETRYTNHLGELAATQRTTTISYATPESQEE